MKKFTELEKQVSKAIDPKYKYMARDGDGELRVFTMKPSKEHYDDSAYYWSSSFDNEYISPFNHLFKSIMTEDSEPTLIKDIYDPQILTTAEKHHLNKVIKEIHINGEIVGVVKVKDYITCVDNIVIKFFNNAIGQCGVTLPSFPYGELFKGMEYDEIYTVDELRLFKEDAE